MKMIDEVLTELRDVLFQIAGREVHPDERLVSYVVDRVKTARNEAILDCIRVCLTPVYKGGDVSGEALRIRDEIVLMKDES